MYLEAFGHSLYVMREPDSTTPYTGWLRSDTPPYSTWADWWVREGENFLRLGRLSVIHTPRGWRQQRRASLARGDRGATTG